MTLLDYNASKIKREAPLASRMRPKTLDEMEGQEHIIGPGKMLRRVIEADMLGSVIFFGPPGTGKTTLARVISNATKSEFVQLNATTSGKKDMETAILHAKNVAGAYLRKTILFIDEIHRFNKAQQDYLLPFVEDGTVSIIGATTENPFFEVNEALISRSIIFELKPLVTENVKNVLNRAMTDIEYGLGKKNCMLDDDARDFIAELSGGDARNALNSLELAFKTTEPLDDGIIHITKEVAEECIQKKHARYDKQGGNHYDTISAFIKSMRGSDPDATVYYLARMLYAGEDIKFIARRIMIAAAEDVGNADPTASILAASCCAEVERIGMPEAAIILSQAATYVACAPKSNAACKAIQTAQNALFETGSYEIPPYLKDAHSSANTALGHGIGYKYPHDYQNHYVHQQYLPEEMADTVFYHPSDQGYEQTITNRLNLFRMQSDASIQQGEQT